MNKTQLTDPDFDEQLAEELQTYNELRDGDVVYGRIDSVLTPTHKDIQIHITFPWGDDTIENFRHPAHDPDDEFEAFVNRIGYDLNAASNIPDEQVPCILGDDEDWHVQFPKTRRQRIGDTLRHVGEKSLEGDSWYESARMMSLSAGICLLFPVVSTIMLIGIGTDLEGPEEPKLNTLILCTMLFGLFDFIWMHFALQLYEMIV